MPLYLHISLIGDKSLTRTSLQMFGYGESPVPNLGACTIAIHTGDRQQPQLTTCQVTDTRGYLILGRESAQQVGYIAFPEVTPPSLTSTPQIHTSVNALRPDSKKVSKPTSELLDDAIILNENRHCLPVAKEYVLSQFKDIYRGGMYHIQLKPDAQPVHHPPRAVPEKKKSAYKDELERLCSSGIVEPVQGHTDWANSVASVSKHDGSIRLCLDPMDINRSIKRNQYYTKTIDEVSAEPLGGKYFTVTDVKSGYWMVELDDESSLLTTFNTLWASDFPLVLKSAQTYFSRGHINAVPKKVKEIMGCIDDIITRGVDSKDHDVNLLQLLETARMNGIKLNPKKLQFKTTKCFFFGQTITLEGMKINYKKPEAIKQMKAPKDKKALQSFQ